MIKKKKKREHPELAEQKIVARFLKLQLDNGRILGYTATPIHYAPHPNQINMNAALGVNKDFPDFNPIILMDLTGWIEMKAPGEKPRPDQLRILKILDSRPGQFANWFDNAKDAINYLTNLIGHDKVFRSADFTKASDEERSAGIAEFSAFLERD